MASSGPDRSIGSKSYFPQWMKSKINDRYDLEQTMAFSPPNNDDGFFLLKHKRLEEPPATPPKPKIVEPKFAPKLQTFDEHPATPATTTLATSALRQFISTNTTPREVGMRHPGEQSLTKIKSSSEDSTKENSQPLGSSSIVAVAHQMIADKNHDFPATETLIPPRLRVRRNSKSLPASPQTSPKIFRKNPFFTNIFFGSSELVNVAEESKTVTRTVSTEDARLDSWSARVAQAFDSPPAAPKVPEATTRVSEATAAAKALKAKPSELREMNFWSPTSM
ncbi:hypothetical protein GE061_007263 [Apolygus lucorum]|uniref:Uncharacterized protein n=1 Tax=Apolygus lucorum TaxID=248454 RepID=A0A8S9WT25_APOLU|nr:hypothetical protein GE061_007263 [Apolygus lucorum]